MKLFPVFSLDKVILNKSAIQRACFGPKNKTIYTWEDNDSLSEWNLSTGNLIHTSLVEYNLNKIDKLLILYKTKTFINYGLHTVELKDTIIIDSSLKYLKEFSSVFDTNKLGWPVYPQFITDMSGAYSNNDTVITWGKNTESVYDAVNIWNSDGIGVGPSLIHDGIEGAILNNDNSMVLTWASDSTARIWKYNYDTSIFRLPPNLMKMKAQIETGVELSLTDNSIKILYPLEYLKRKKEYLKLYQEYLEKKRK